MKIDEKTLAILGPAKEGFEWMQKSWLRGVGEIMVVDTVIDSGGVRWDITDGNLAICLGICYGTGKFFRQVPIEPEPEVIWGTYEPACWHMRILADGTLQKNDDPNGLASNRGWEKLVTTGQFADLVRDHASQHKELKTLKEKRPEEGTFAWAIEQMKAGRKVQVEDSGFQYRFTDKGWLQEGNDAGDWGDVSYIRDADFQANTWRVVE